MWTMDVKRYMRGNTHLVTLLSQLLLSLTMPGSRISSSDTSPGAIWDSSHFLTFLLRYPLQWLLTWSILWDHPRNLREKYRCLSPTQEVLIQQVPGVKTGIQKLLKFCLFLMCTCSSPHSLDCQPTDARDCVGESILAPACSPTAGLLKVMSSNGNAGKIPIHSVTALLPPLIADIPVIPDLEEMQEEDFVLQVAAPPRYSKLGMKSTGGREYGN